MTLVTTATELPRLMQCIGSRLMPVALPPDHDHEARDEGNAAHWLSKEWFDGRIPQPVAGIKAYNGYVITDEMIEHVGQYIQQLDVGQMEVETTFSGVDWEVRARADHIHCGPDTLTVDDFKYGYRLVEARENWTLIAHAIGWCIRNKVVPDRITLRIHQPRAYHPDGPTREWSCRYADLMDYYRQISERLSSASDILRTGPMCGTCHALATCPSARAATMNAIDASGVAFSDDLPDAVLIHEFETLGLAERRIKERKEALEELMTHKAKMGHVFPGYGLKPRYGHSKWKTGLTGKALSIATGVDVVKDAAVTPAEAKRRGVPDAVIDALTDRPLIGSKLQRIDADAEGRRIFGEK